MGGVGIQRCTLMIAVGAAHIAVALAFAHMELPERAPIAQVVMQTRFFQPEERIVEPVLPPLRIEPARLSIQVQEPTLAYEMAIAVDASPVSTAPIAITASSPSVQPAASVSVENVEYVQPPKPRYPPLSRRLKEQGVVVLRVLVDEHGEARKIEVADSSGHERLDHAAVEAVAGATFRPFLENGTARAMLVLIPIEFGLRRVRT
jgi:periplasmic protein TonB